MPLRILGALALIAAGSVAAYAYASALRQKLTRIDALLEALDFIRTQIDQLRTPLPQIIAALAAREGMIGELFAPVQTQIEADERVGTALVSMSAQFDDRQIHDTFLSLAAALGRYEADEQVLQIRYTISRIAARREELYTARRQKAPLVYRIGVSAGLCMAILLL